MARAFGREAANGGASPASGGLYRPRNPRESPLWQCARRHATELREAGRLQRAVEGQVIERSIECGDPHHGFARIRKQARLGYLSPAAFSQQYQALLMAA